VPALRLVIACALALITPPPAPPAAAGPNLRAIELGIFEAVNLQRREHGLPPLRWNNRLAEESRRHSRGMAERWFFSHADPLRGDLAQRLKEGGIPWRLCAENLFEESGYADPVKAAVDGWMRSPGHRRNILDKRMTETGVGAALRGADDVFITQEFLLPPEAPSRR
jgi:uncharacterized protein YkwD